MITRREQVRLVLQDLLRRLERQEFRVERGQEQHIVSVFGPMLLRRILQRLPKRYGVAVTTQKVEVWGTAHEVSGYVARLGDYPSRAEARHAAQEYLDDMLRSGGQDQPV